jgi:malonyl-CoA decarboxylase
MPMPAPATAPPTGRSTGTSSITLDPRSWLERLWNSIAERGRPYADVPASSVPPLDRAKQLASALLSERGEASGAAVARELHSVLRELGPEERLDFYRFLASGFLPDEKRLREAASAYLAEPTPEHVTHLHDAAEPPRQELLRRMNMAPGGTPALVAMRDEIGKRLRDEPDLRPLDSDLLHLLGSWFNRGFLQIRRIDWQTPAAVLEKLIAYEAVHEIQGWDDLRRRLAPDRRCFGFFHPALPGEPLIFVEVALTEGLASAVQPLLAREDDERAQRQREAQADTAIFYSISNCQKGLRGVSFGNFLIKQVVEELKAELPRLRQFSTLSPVPGFRRWFGSRLAETDASLLSADESIALRGAAGMDNGAGDGVAALRTLLESDTWWEEADKAAALRKPVTRLCALYLTGTTPRSGDPVARFHLGNGARLERINWFGNIASRGIKESFGIMVNYLYDPDSIEANHEAFARDGNVMRSASVDELLTPREKPSGKGQSRAARLAKT